MNDIFSYKSYESIWDTFDKMFDDFDEFFQTFNEDLVTCFYKSYPSFPPTNMYVEKDKTLVIEIAVAGYPKEGVSLEFAGDTLIVKLEPSKKIKDVKYLKKGIKEAKVEAKYFIPIDKYSTDIVSKLKDGLLTISIPAKEPVEPRKIDIEIEKE